MLGELPRDSIAEVSFQDEWVVCERKTEAVQAQREAWGEGEVGVRVEWGWRKEEMVGLRNQKRPVGQSNRGRRLEMRPENHWRLDHTRPISQGRDCGHCHSFSQR